MTRETRPTEPAQTEARTPETRAPEAPAPHACRAGRLGAHCPQCHGSALERAGLTLLVRARPQTPRR